MSSQKMYSLRVFIGEEDRFERMSLYEWLVTRAKKEGLSGATVTRGIMGFGENSNIKSSKILSLSTDLPIIVEIIDEKEKLDSFLPIMNEAVKDGMATMQEIEVLFSRHKK